MTANSIFNLDMYFTGLIIGIATFLIIGLFHPLVIKGEYYFGVRIWWIFALMNGIYRLFPLLPSSYLRGSNSQR